MKVALYKSFKLTSLAFLLYACLAPVTHAEKKLVVYTVNYPLYYFAQRIGGEHITVELPAPAGVDPAFWKPGLTVITQYQSADLILLNGANYAKWVNKVSLPKRRLVDTSISFSSRYIKSNNTMVHNHGTQGEHSHAGIAFTTWLDFSQAMEQAKAITRALSKKRPDLKHVFEQNNKLLLHDLDKLDQDMVQVARELAGEPLLASHPVYQYLARRYNLKIESVIWEPDVYPTTGQWNILQQKNQEYSAKVMLWEGTSLDKTENKLRELGVQTVVFEPCMNRPVEGDFFTVMQKNIDNLKKVN